MLATDEEKYQDLRLPIGRIKGIHRKGIYEDEYISFEGIPYGQPPVGERRFKAPVPVKPWPGVRDCFGIDAKPVQRNDKTGELCGTEDCLYLNVYVKRLKSEKPLPVLVYIYGGRFSVGEANRSLYSPDYLMREDIIVVTVNYRVGPLGFLSVEDPSLEIPGNAGLKDQILALKWVQQFIKYFNGDASNVTVAGNSAGGASVHFLTAAKPAEGLFHKAVCMSGSALNIWAISPLKDRAYRLAVLHGYKGPNVDANVVQYLGTLKSSAFAQADILTEEDKRNGFAFPFGPCIEPYDSEDCVVPKEPLEMLKTAWGNEIPMIFSGVRDEGLTRYQNLKAFPRMMPTLQQKPELLLPFVLRQGQNAADLQEKGQRLFKHHFGKKPIDKVDIQDCLQYFGIGFFWHGIHRSLLSRLAYAKAPTFLYRLSFDSPTFNHQRKKFCGDDLKSGVSHAEDMSYLWYSYFAWKLEESSDEYRTIRRMVSMLSSFAKDGAPSIPNEISDGAKWLPLESSDASKALNIDRVLEFKTIPEKEDFVVWDTLYNEGELY